MSYVVGFSWDKLQAAKSFLCAVKPRWSRYLSRFTFVPFTVAPPQGRDWGGVVFSTPTWHIYVDSNYVSHAPVEHIAGLIEKELHHAARNMRGRLYRARRGDYLRYARIAAEMEVCDVLRRESQGKNLVDAYTNPLAHTILSREELSRWGIVDIPRVPDDCAWYPEAFGYPAGLAMEEYFSLLCSGETGQEGASPGDEQEGEGDATDRDGGELGAGDTEGSNDSPESEQGEPTSEDGCAEDVRSEAHEDEPGAVGGDEGEGEGAAQDDDEVNGATSGAGEDDSDAMSNESESEAEPSMPEAPGGVPADIDEGESSAKGAQEGESAGESADRVDGEGKGAPPGRGATSAAPATTGGVEGEGEASPHDAQDALTVQEMIDELSKEPGRDWFAREFEPMDPPPTDAVDTTVQDSDALEELAEDIAKSVEAGYGILPGDEMRGFSTDILKRGRTSWERALADVLARTIGETKIHGLQDYSYSVRNRNQQETGPVLMGMYDSDPSIFVIIDTSGSMKDFVGESLSAFSDVLFRTAATSGAEVGWASVSVGVVDAGVSRVLNEDMAKDFVLGFGGTDMADTIKDVVSGRFKWQGRSFEQPDILIIITDCQWNWPWSNRRRIPSNTHIVVASVLGWSEAWLYRDHPKWLTKRQWVVVGE